MIEEQKKKDREEKEEADKITKAKEEVEAMTTGDIGDMMSQFKEQKNITGEGITNANKLVSEAQDTIEKAQQVPAAEKPVEEAPKKEESSEPAPDSSNVQLNSDVNIATHRELVAIETSSETQRLLDEANSALDIEPKSKKVSLSAKPVIKNATKKVMVNKKVEATKKPTVAPKKIVVAEKKPTTAELKAQVAIIQKH